MLVLFEGQCLGRIRPKQNATAGAIIAMRDDVLWKISSDADG
ncbi:hypothetical protein LALCM10_170189 [Dellaglioa algida]|nr:hypothetical protein LALCM10_170189 [Dellaglioa algida]